MKKMNSAELARVIDISAVRAESTVSEVNQIVEVAKRFNFICVFSMPSMLPYVFSKLKDVQDVRVGGIVGFPSGGETTECKVWQACDLKQQGCDEIDMVMNIGKLKSGMYSDVLRDIRYVKEAVGSTPLKVIIEVSLLSDEEITKAAQIVWEAGADYVKTGTGWAGATTVHHVDLIKSAVGDKIKLKVAGGVRTLETLEEMYEAGVSRFGIGYKSALNIMQECLNRENHERSSNSL